MSKKKSKNIFQTHGKIEDGLQAIDSIHKIMGVNRRNPFGVSTVEKLEEKLVDMQLIDLQKLAISAGIPGGGDRSVLKMKIRNEFLRFMRGGGEGVVWHTEGKFNDDAEGVKAKRFRELTT